jgi:hypothetical protein
MKYYRTDSSLFRIDTQQNVSTWAGEWIHWNEYRDYVIKKILTGDAWPVSEDTLPAGAI